MTEEQNFEGMKIHIVEDSPIQAAVLKKTLESKGYTVLHSKDGQEAYERIQDDIPSLVITDVEMPRMNGFDLCLRLREAPQLENLPIILLTSLSSPLDVIKATRCYADNFITKPFQSEFLLKRVAQILGDQNGDQGSSNAGEVDLVIEDEHFLLKPDIVRTTKLLSSVYEDSIQRNQELQNAYWKLEELHTELKQKNEELRQLNEQKNYFLGIAAHDLRNPLGSILTTSKFLLGRNYENLTDIQLELLGMIRSGSDFMLSLVNDLLDVSAIESGKLNLQFEAMNVHELVRKNFSRNEIMAKQKNIQLELASSEQIKTITTFVDKNKFEQVMDNLISNAIKFSPEESAIEIGLEMKGDKIHIYVKDNGQGIPKEEQGKIFHAFEKTSVMPTAGEKSTGLGLAITQKIVNAHGGDINVDSTEGCGSTFHIYLPIRSKED